MSDTALLPADDTTKRRRRKVIAIVAVTAALVAAGGGAFAYWSATGAGTSTGTTGAGTTAVTVNQTTAVTDLRPGGAAQTLSGTFTNTNTGPVYVTTVTAAISGVAKATGAPTGTCDATDYTLANAAMTVAADVPAGAAKGAWTGATIVFNNKATNQDACKGATVNLSYTAN